MTDSVEALVAALSVEDRLSLARLLVKGTGSYVVPQDLLLGHVPTYELAYIDGFDFVGLPSDKSHLKPTAKTPDEHPAITLSTFLSKKHQGWLFYTSPKESKYMRVVREMKSAAWVDAEASAYCFVDAEGNIYKAAGWYTHAKGIRSTVNSVLNEFTLTDPYGAWLYAKQNTAS